MDFTFDSEQNDLREAVRGLLDRAYGDGEQRRRVTGTDPGFEEKTWSRLAEMGLLGLPFAEDGSDVPDWARVTAPHYLNYRKVSIYGGSNEVQRTIIAGTILGL